MEDIIWGTFVETGKISKDYIRLIAKKIKFNKELSTKELSVYKEHSHDIENILKMNER